MDETGGCSIGWSSTSGRSFCRCGWQQLPQQALAPQLQRGRTAEPQWQGWQSVQCLQCGWQQLLVAECWRHSAYLQALAPQLQKGRMEQSQG